MFEFMNITKALADEKRIRILLALSGKEELCVCQLIDMLQLAPSTVSKHLFILRSARLIQGRKQGRWMYYRLAEEGASDTVTEALGWVARAVADEPLIRQDAARLSGFPAEGPSIRCGA